MPLPPLLEVVPCCQTGPHRLHWFVPEGSTRCQYFMHFILNRGGAKIPNRGTSLVIQWLRPCASSAGGMGSIPGRGTKIPHTVQCSQNPKYLPVNSLFVAFHGCRYMLVLSMNSRIRRALGFWSDPSVCHHHHYHHQRRREAAPAAAS